MHTVYERRYVDANLVSAGSFMPARYLRCKVRALADFVAKGVVWSGHQCGRTGRCRYCGRKMVEKVPGWDDLSFQQRSDMRYLSSLTRSGMVGIRREKRKWYIVDDHGQADGKQVSKTIGLNTIRALERRGYVTVSKHVRSTRKHERLFVSLNDWAVNAEVEIPTTLSSGETITVYYNTGTSAR